jgi:cell division septum initiation protein DivIVA
VPQFPAVDREDWTELRAMIREDLREVLAGIREDLRADRDELLASIRADTRRSDQRWAQTVARWDKREERRHHEAMAHIAEIRAKTDEIIAEGRAQRAALFRLLDRLDGGGGAAPAT